MSTAKENSNSAQHSQHGPWQGELGKGLEEESIARVCSEQQHCIPQHQIWGVLWGLWFVCSKANILSCHEEGCQQDLLPMTGVKSPRQTDTSHWHTFTSSWLMKKVNLLWFPFSWFAVTPNSQKVSGSKPCGTARCLPENSFPWGGPCLKSVGATTAMAPTPTLTSGMWWRPWHTGVQDRRALVCWCHSHQDENTGQGCQALTGKWRKMPF